MPKFFVHASSLRLGRLVQLLGPVERRPAAGKLQHAAPVGIGGRPFGSKPEGRVDVQHAAHDFLIGRRQKSILC